MSVLPSPAILPLQAALKRQNGQSCVFLGVVITLCQLWLPLPYRRRVSALGGFFGDVLNGWMRLLSMALPPCKSVFFLGLGWSNVSFPGQICSLIPSDFVV